MQSLKPIVLNTSKDRKGLTQKYPTLDLGTQAEPLNYILIILVQNVTKRIVRYTIKHKPISKSFACQPSRHVDFVTCDLLFRKNIVPSKDLGTQ